jgi:hypothetical protein
MGTGLPIYDQVKSWTARWGMPSAKARRWPERRAKLNRPKTGPAEYRALGRPQVELGIHRYGKMPAVATHIPAVRPFAWSHCFELLALDAKGAAKRAGLSPVDFPPYPTRLAHGGRYPILRISCGRVERNLSTADPFPLAASVFAVTRNYTR